MTYGRSLVGKYVIPKQKYWLTPEEMGNYNAQGKKLFPFHDIQLKLVPETETADAYIQTFAKVSERSQILISTNYIPIWYVTGVLPDGFVEVQKTFYMPKYKYGDYIAVKPENLTEFVVYVKPDAPETGSLGEHDEGRVGVVVNDTEDPDDEFFVVKDKLSGKKSVYRKDNLILKDVSELKKQAQFVRDLMLVSKQGFLPSYMPADIEKIILSQLTGFPEGWTLQEILDHLRLDYEGPNKNNQPNALNIAPLPHGPTEANFAGGKRKTRKALRKRRSRKTRSQRKKNVKLV